MATGTYDWLNRALDGDAVWDLGQIGKLDKRVLDQAVRAGQLCKARLSWMGISPLKTVWYRADNAPWEFFAQQWRAQQKASHRFMASDAHQTPSCDKRIAP